MLAGEAGEGIKELLREVVRDALQGLIQEELTAAIGAARHERTESRTGQRNGGRNGEDADGHPMESAITVTLLGRAVRSRRLCAAHAAVDVPGRLRSRCRSPHRRSWRAGDVLDDRREVRDDLDVHDVPSRDARTRPGRARSMERGGLRRRFAAVDRSPGSPAALHHRADVRRNAGSGAGSPTVDLVGADRTREGERQLGAR